MQRKVECERKAVRIVEQLLEENITEEFLKECVCMKLTNYQILNTTSVCKDLPMCMSVLYICSCMCVHFECTVPRVGKWLSDPLELVL